MRLNMGRNTESNLTAAEDYVSCVLALKSDAPMWIFPPFRFSISKHDESAVFSPLYVV